MHIIALVSAVLGLALGAFAYPWFFLGLGCGVAGVGFGWLAYRDRRGPMATRAIGAVAMGLATAATALTATRTAITILALAKVRAWLGG